MQLLSEEHLKWIASLPLYIELDNCFISHSSVKRGMTLERACSRDKWQDLDDGILWNRDYPTPREDGKLQVFGHNSQFGLKKFYTPASKQLVVDDKPFAICIDDSAKKRLTAYNTKTGEIYQENYGR